MGIWDQSATELIDGVQAITAIAKHYSETVMQIAENQQDTELMLRLVAEVSSRVEMMTEAFPNTNALVMSMMTFVLLAAKNLNMNQYELTELLDKIFENAERNRPEK